jgi:hypothetical protein
MSRDSMKHHVVVRGAEILVDDPLCIRRQTRACITFDSMALSPSATAARARRRSRRTD